MRRKQEKGITLIALVVTIIILLLLAAIGLRGINPLIFKAKEATNKWEDAEDDEGNQLDEIVGWIDSVDPNPDSNKKRLCPEIPEIPDVSSNIDLPASRPYSDFPDYIPIYTVEQYKDIASEKTGYVINDLSGTYVGTYTMATNAKYVFMNDIDFASAGNIEPIRNFNGVLEGNGHTLNNLTIDTTDLPKDFTNLVYPARAKTLRPAGVFEYIKDAEVRNFAVINANITSPEESAAAIAGQCNNSTITNCYVKNSTINGASSTAGIVGFVGPDGATVSKCKTITTNIIASSALKASAGIVSTSYGDIRISDCNVVNESTLNSMQLYAGILKYTMENKSATITNCNVQNINLCDENSGGILAVAGGNVTIDKCYTKNLSGVGALLLAYVSNNSDKVTITNCSSQHSEMEMSNGMIGVLCLKGNSYETSAKIENCTMKDVLIKARRSRFFGSYWLLCWYKRFRNF